jgi:hypothetical protein
MGRSTPFGNSSACASAFLIGQDSEGHWIARDKRGLTGGVFVNKLAAIKFAMFESDRRPNAVLFLPEHIKLTLSGALPALAVS